MKLTTVIVLALMMSLFGPSQNAESNTGFSFSFGFHDELEPYGAWVHLSHYGNVWRPYVYDGWRPYTDGYWAYSSYGLTWNGNEPWAWIAYHYGYWIFTPEYGWVWIPGYEWHPGRVEWCYGGGYIGWRPLFPTGYHGYGDRYYPGHYGSDFNLWVFINVNYFGYRSYSPYAVHHTTVRNLFDRRIVRRRHGTFHHSELRQVLRTPVRTVSVVRKEANVGGRKVRMIVTDREEARIREHQSRMRTKGPSKQVNRSSSTTKGRSYGFPSKSRYEPAYSARHSKPDSPPKTNRKTVDTSRKGFEKKFTRSKESGSFESTKRSSASGKSSRYSDRSRSSHRYTSPKYTAPKSSSRYSRQEQTAKSTHYRHSRSGEHSTTLRSNKGKEQSRKVVSKEKRSSRKSTSSKEKVSKRSTKKPKTRDRGKPDR